MSTGRLCCSSCAFEVEIDEGEDPNDLIDSPCPDCGASELYAESYMDWGADEAPF